MAEFHSVEAALQQHLPEDVREEVFRILHGTPSHTKIEVTKAAAALAEAHNFEIAAWCIPCAVEQLRAPRRVRLGAIQNTIVLPTDAPLADQYRAIEAKIEKMIEAAAAMGVNVLCLQEAWTAAFFFCTREKMPWCEVAEDPKTGHSVAFIRKMAAKFNMVIVSPILERDAEHQDIIWNTAVVIGNNGNYIGKHRKNHIPRVGDFNESTYYMEGNDGHPVFDTAFGKIAINICYGRHHPLNWAMFGLNGAEVVFNPSATVGGLSEPLWAIEARNAAIANSYYAVGINRVGTESFKFEFTSGDGKPAHHDFGHFYGSSYVACPNGVRTPGLSRVRDGLLVTEVDLNLCRQTRDKWCFPMTQRLDLYGPAFTKAASLDFKRQIIHDNGTDNE